MLLYVVLDSEWIYSLFQALGSWERKKGEGKYCQTNTSSFKSRRRSWNRSPSPLPVLPMFLQRVQVTQ